MRNVNLTFFNKLAD